MYHWMITCMGVTNISLTHEIRETLLKEAVAIVHGSGSRRSFKLESAEGAIEKMTDHTSFLSESGPLFFAEIETDLGKGKTTFIVSKHYLEALAAGAKFGESISFESDSRRSSRAVWN